MAFYSKVENSVYDAVNTTKFHLEQRNYDF